MRPESGTPIHEVRLQSTDIWQYLRLVTAITIIFLAATASAVQSSPTAHGARKTAPHKTPANGDKATGTKAGDPDLAWLQELLKNKELMAELDRLGQKLKDGIQYPAARSQSHILSRLPDSTVFYVALPNYGDTFHQAKQIFHQELEDSAPLRDFLQKNKLDAMESKIENGIEQFYEFSQFLGDELIITGKMGDQEPAFMLVAEVSRPGIKEFLEKMNAEIFTDKTDRARIVDAQELASTAPGKKDAPVILVRPDLVVMGLGMESVREFNTQIDQGGPRFTTGLLGQRVAQAYQGGASTVFGIDLHKVIGLLPQSNPQSREMLEKTGFADVNYLVSENKISGGRSANKMELTFNGPRRGVASWIAGAAPMGGLDFISGNAAMAGDLMLKDPTQIFDDLREIMGKNAFATLPQMEAQLNVNLKDDLLSKLSGEIAFEVQAPPTMVPGDGATKAATPQGAGAFKVILRVRDPDGLQQTLSRLLVMAPMQSGKREEDGVTFNTLTSPGPAGKTTEINYFFMDGYLVIASDRETASEAVRQHRAGDSLSKSSKLREALAGQPANASIMFYQNAGQMMGPMFAQLPPELRQLLPNTNTLNTKANVFYVNADKNSFRGSTSDNINTDMSVGLIVAAIAIPNLLRSRIAANESAATATVRTVNTAQVVYETTYPRKGYAPSLAVLGPPPGSDCSKNDDITPAHACLLNETVGNASCTAGKWCTKNGFRYSVRGVCTQTSCRDYVVTATPVNTGTGTKSFCSVNDAVVRTHMGAPLETPLTVAECKAWRPIQ